MKSRGAKKSLDSRSAAQLFTSRAINKIAQEDFSLLYKILKEYLNPKTMPVRVSDIFEMTFKKYSEDYKTEYFFKNTLANKIFLRRHKNNNSTMITELRVGSNKADCVIVNGHSTCYEIKTEFDNLKRLPDQVATYLKVFEKVYVVCAVIHTQNVLSMIPGNVGVIEINQKGALQEVRKAGESLSELDTDIMISSLRKSEYIYMAETLIGRKLESSNMQVFSDCLDIFNDSSSDEVREVFKEALKKYRKADFRLIDALPPSLTNSAISFKLTLAKQNAFKNVLSRYIE